MSAPDSTTILREILAAMRRQDAARKQRDVVRRACAARVRELQATAVRMFAGLNGWRPATIPPLANRRATP
jgi:hypothetical protein